ncbi:MAG: alanine--tRNA ligase [Anaerovoracaceae bacterium]
MEKLGLNQIRDAFSRFYISKDHYKRKSFSLIPESDKSLLLINSGMAPLKPYFSGLETPPAKRMTTCQKCIRTGDIENVGITSRHGTFFEMLGSFSFGDYFKKESIAWGWEFITEILKLPLDKLWVTVYEEDQDSYDIWKDDIKFPEERIVRLGKDDNFWEIGTGPCGPCSEIYYDRGEKYGCDNPDCKPGCECDRYVEFWNHVFTQFSKDEDGNYTDLAHPNIDTGMGLERLACIMQGVDSIFDIDTIKYVLNAVVEKSGVAYKHGDAPTDISLRIITDHIRSVVFMIGDGIIPSNEGRRYVLRRLLRRAARHGKLLGIEGCFLAELSSKVIDECGGAYPELEEKRVFIKRIIENEELRFIDTLDQGTEILEGYIEEIKKENKAILPGEKIFKLYDTYGFPVELTEEILVENGCTGDIEGFMTSMEKQKMQGHKDKVNQDDEAWKEDSLGYIFEGKTEFTGYDKTEDNGVIKGLFHNNQPLDSIEEGETGRIVLDKTPFYPESGGQSGDVGLIYNDDVIARVVETIKFQEVIAHKVIVEKGTVFPQSEVYSMIDIPTRNNASRNHTATHLLHKALREVLGDHVQQEGSSVSATGLRFDFNHFEPLTEENLKEVTTIVNDKIIHFLPVTTEELTLKEAMKSGAIGLFDEKYGSVVRVVSIGEYSKELCGGTHVDNIGQIGSFKIVNESSAAAGVRRIEAITGRQLLIDLYEREELLDAAGSLVKGKPEQLVEKLENLLAEKKELEKELEKFKKNAIGNAIDKLFDDAEEVNGITLITRVFKDYTIDDLRGLSDEIRDGKKNIVMVFATQSKSKVTFLVSLTDDLLDKGYHAGKMIKEIAAKAGGSGGGKADMAQAGAKDPSKIKEAFAMAKELLQ